MKEENKKTSRYAWYKLFRGLRCRDWQVRKNSANSFGSLAPYIPEEKKDKLIELLTKMLFEDMEWHWGVRESCIKALGYLAPYIPKEKRDFIIESLVLAGQCEVQAGYLKGMMLTTLAIYRQITW